MWTIVFLLIGMAAGLLLRRRTRVLGMLDRTGMLLIYALVFFLGLSFRSDLIKGSSGVELFVTALMLALGGIGGSLLLTWLLSSFL